AVIVDSTIIKPKGHIMRFLFSSLVFISISFFSVAGFSSTISVNGLQGSVWIERNQNRQVLTTDTIIKSSDVVVTGETGKVWLNMDDGAVIKLGNKARMKVDSIQTSDDPGTQSTLLEASSNIAEGAFRYTTGFINAKTKQTWSRQIDIGLSTTAAIGIRG